MDGKAPPARDADTPKDGQRTGRDRDWMCAPPPKHGDRGMKKPLPPKRRGQLVEASIEADVELVVADPKGAR